MRYFFFLCFPLFFMSCQSSSKSINLDKLQTGDFIFQDLDCGPLCDAIEAVTDGYEEWDFSHVGMVIRQKDSLFVMEATSPVVVLTPIEHFLNRSRNKEGVQMAISMRLKEEFQHLIPEAVEHSKAQLGKPYDVLYLMDNESYYCSELLSEAFYLANNNVHVFPPSPMTYKSPASNDYFPAWVDYYKNLGAQIPQGLPGVNPGGMSLSSYLEILR